MNTCSQTIPLWWRPLAYVVKLLESHSVKNTLKQGICITRISEAPFNNTGKAEIFLCSGLQSGIIILRAKSGWMESLNRFLFMVFLKIHGWSPRQGQNTCRHNNHRQRHSLKKQGFAAWQVSVKWLRQKKLCLMKNIFYTVLEGLEKSQISSVFNSFWQEGSSIGHWQVIVKGSLGPNSTTSWSLVLFSILGSSDLYSLSKYIWST